MNPLCPKLSGGRSAPPVESFVAASCQPIDRASSKPSVMFSRNILHVSGVEQLARFAQKLLREQKRLTRS